MISSLTGTIRHLSADKAVIDVGGVGYALTIHLRTSSQISLGASVTLNTSLVVREDSMTLFGFFDEDERELFELLQTVTGIGPKVALAITGALTPSDLMSAIASEDVIRIEKIPGIGRKGAQRLILELKGKISTFGTHEIVVQPSLRRDQLRDALVGLGFSVRESDVAITSTFATFAENGQNPEDTDLSALLKIALQSGKR